MELTTAQSELFTQCKQAAGPAWLRYESHPWFSALESGALPVEQFVSFQLNDAPFLPFLHQTLAIGLSKAPTGSPWSRAVTTLLSDVFVAKELQTKREILEGLGIKDVRFDRWALTPRREGYVNHLLRVAHEGSASEIAAALLPCTLFTQIVGKRFENVEIKGPPIFKRWAQIYAEKQMFQMPIAHLTLMESSVRQHAALRDELIRNFVRSTQHQVSVFDDALEPGPGWPAVAHPEFQLRGGR